MLVREFRMKDTQGEGSHLFYEAAEQGSFELFTVYFRTGTNLLMRLSCATTGHSPEKILLCIRSGSLVKPVLPVKG